MADPGRTAGQEDQRRYRADPDKPPGTISGLSRQNSVYRRTMAACDKLAAAVVQGADAAELTKIFAETAGKTVVLLDPEFRLQSQAASDDAAGPIPWDPGDTSVTKLLRMLAAECRPLRVPPVPGSALAFGCLATPVTVGDAALGYLLALGEDDSNADDVDLIVTGYAATLFALTLARARTTLELGLRYQGAIVDSLVSGHFLDSQDACRKARILGVTDGQPFRVAVARADPVAASRLGRPGEREPTEDLLTRLAGSLDCATAIRGPELVALLPVREQADTPTAGSGTDANFPTPLRHALLPRQIGPAGLTCGLSELTWLPEMAPQALRQAQHAIDIGIRIGRAGETTSYEDLGIYLLGPLIDYDARHKVNLVATLSAYLNQHESLKQTARVLRVHVNTVTYRIQRIEQLTALDLANPDHRLSAHVAAKIIETQRAAER